MTVKVVNKGKPLAAKVHLYSTTKKDTSGVTVNPNLEVEDEFAELYYSDKNATGLILQPPFNPKSLKSLTRRNNTLAQAIAAMEVNVDGTGFSIDPINPGEVAKDALLEQAKSLGVAPPVKLKGPEPSNQSDSLAVLDKKETPQTKTPAAPSADSAPVAPFGQDWLKNQQKKTIQQKLQPEDPEKLMLESFFREPYPGVSFVTIRRQLRCDLEATGNAYLEVIRNLNNQIVFLRYVDAAQMRLVKLDDPVPVEVTVERNGQSFTATVFKRERRYVQKVGQKFVYFKEFNASRDINRNNGSWTETNKLLVQERGSEMIHFTVDTDVNTPYGIPRWINETPSILGSRKAEEFNLQFFDAGGVPPAIVFVQGGALVGDASEQLRGYLSGKQTHRVAVVEIQSSTGDLNAAGNIKVTTERFGDSKSNDAMFKEYDNKCEKRVRQGFRLPPLFFGEATDHNYATAMTSYMVAEAQVFAPERTEFDEIINATICKSLGAKKYKFVSKSITLKNMDIQMQVLPLIQGLVDSQEFIEAVNEIAGTHFEYSPEAEQNSKTAQLAGKVDPQTGQPLQLTLAQTAADPKTPSGGNPDNIRKGSVEYLYDLADRWMQSVGVKKATRQLTLAEKSEVILAVRNLEPDEKKVMLKFLAGEVGPKNGPTALGAGCVEAMSRQPA